MLVGSTGSGKSSTINALFSMQVAEVGVGVGPETSNITSYTLDNLTIWDTPGLGDGIENDKGKMPGKDVTTMNRVILMGRLTKNPEINYAGKDNDMAVARYTLAIVTGKP